MALKKILILFIIIVISCLSLMACTPTHPYAKVQYWFETEVNVFPENSGIFISQVASDDYDHNMFRCFVKSENLDKFEPSQYDIGNIYFIMYNPNGSYDTYVNKSNYVFCTDDPSEKNPEFAQFLKDNHWGEKFTDYEKLYESAELPTLFEEKDSELLNELAEKMAELAVGKKSGKTESYVLGKIRSNYVSGIYYYGDFDLENMTMKFIRINITEEMLKEYKENGTVSSQGISVEDFDPYRYSEYADEIIRNAL